MKPSLTMVRTVMAWLGLIGASGSISMVHAEDVFSGHRLFFTEAQRKQATLKESDVSTESLPGAPAQELEDASAERDSSSGEHARTDSFDARQRPLSTTRQDASTNRYRVYFNGLVTGKREPRILVNGLPCEPASAEYSGKSDQLVPINCHGMRNDELSLSVSIISGKLLVTDRRGRVHHLVPGEGV